MGCLCSSTAQVSPEEVIDSNKVDKELADSKKKDSQIRKLLLLGPGQSGKSTFYKQIKNLYGNPWTDDQLTRFVPLIQRNLIDNMRSLIKYSNSSQEYDILDQSKSSATLLWEAEDIRSLDTNTTNAIITLWGDPGIQKVWKDRAKFQIDDSCSYFYAKVESIAKSDYIPSLDDIFNLRVRTTGITEMKFQVEGVPYLMVDVGGQRNERKKWIHCFQGVTAVLFVVSANEYDQHLFEEESVNRMLESLKLWDDIVNSSYFLRSSIILFLNKCDLFREKIKHVPITVFFSGYRGSNKFDDAIQYIQDQFLALIHDSDRIVYVHWTSAIDTDNIKQVFSDVRETILVKSLDQIGLGV